MRIDYIDIENFRCVRRLSIELREKTNIFVGINGSGKSALLECLAVLLSRLLAKIRSPEERGSLMFSGDDVTIGEGTTTCKIGISAAVDGDLDEVSWTLIKHRRRGKGKKTSDLKELTAFAEKISKKLHSEDAVNLPLALYYPVNRDVIDIPLRIRKKPPFEQLSAYDGAIGLQRDYFRTFFAWFRNREDFENERRVRQNPEYRDRELEAVRTAIETFLGILHEPIKTSEVSKFFGNLGGLFCGDLGLSHREGRIRQGDLSISKVRRHTGPPDDPGRDGIHPPVFAARTSDRVHEGPVLRISESERRCEAR